LLLSRILFRVTTSPGLFAGRAMSLKAMACEADRIPAVEEKCLLLFQEDSR